ncbi:MAG: pilus assembly protein PilM [Methylotenera sp.]|uniref:pilus assembly protein PilM n=1 Tax=Methylotenera sp. TaxID=2051956 RepID=UPI00271E3E74|nr:pilus assembly protein PilM [Methylotenera sp.]MDO9393105.1 pilus assembly protein PilM [Methylotenera sp.]MDP1523937.1 pilus assembly protein PilM [Methylotenera sp.]MDP2172754.1 pilus assembly protein PilM [Candidatus Cloacimonadaceae bacterium]MDZ4213063.1 pilus assembly protein PilM [Methylotenera sp.]
MNIDFKKLLSKFSSKFANALGSRFCIGLDMGLDRLNLVQMEQLAGKMHIRAIASIAYPCSREELQANPKILKTLLKQAYATQPFRGKCVVSCLPIDQIKIITITYKHTEGQDDAVAVVAELRERYKSELDNLVVDFMSLRQEEAGSNHRDALVALAPREKVVAYLDLLTSAGLSVNALDIGPAALARLVSHTGAIHVPEYPKLPNVLLINFGSDSSFLTIIWGRRLMLDRPVEFSENRMFNRLKHTLDMPEELMIRLLYENNTNAEKTNGKNVNAKSANNSTDEINQMVTEVLRPEINALLQEVNKTLVYMASKTRGKSVGQIYLTGRVAGYPGILNYLREQLHVAVDILDPVEVFAAEKYKLSSHSIGAMPGIALTTGLALRGIPEHG